jgi:hypothetical protein
LKKHEYQGRVMATAIRRYGQIGANPRAGSGSGDTTDASARGGCSGSGWSHTRLALLALAGGLALLPAFTLAQAANATRGPYAALGASATGFQTRCTGGACDRRAAGVRLAAGWDFASRWSVEALYLDAGRFTASDLTAGGVPFRGRVDVRAFGATVGYGFPLGHAFTITARIGLASVKADFKPGPMPAIAGGKTTSQFLGGLSGTWRLSPTWSARFDWDHTRGRMNRFNGDIDAVTVGFQYGF